MSDFVRNHRVDLFRFKKLKKGTGNKNITKFFNQAHNPGRNHSATEYRPVKNIIIFYPGLLHKLSIRLLSNPFSRGLHFQNF